MNQKNISAKNIKRLRELESNGDEELATLAAVVRQIGEVRPLVNVNAGQICGGTIGTKSIKANTGIVNVNAGQICGGTTVNYTCKPPSLGCVKTIPAHGSTIPTKICMGSGSNQAAKNPPYDSIWGDDATIV